MVILGIPYFLGTYLLERPLWKSFKAWQFSPIRMSETKTFKVPDYFRQKIYYFMVEDIKFKKALNLSMEI